LEKVACGGCLLAESRLLRFQHRALLASFGGGQKAWLLLALACDLEVVYEAGFAEARGGEYSQVCRVAARGAEVLCLTDREVVRAEPGALEGLNAGAFDTGEIGVAGA
jgi:hypothetical protein